MKKLLLIHGWGCNAAVYSSIVNHLSGRYEIFLPELPGFGGTPPPPVPWGVSDYARYIVEYCNENKFKPDIIFGHSLGCRISIKLLSGESDFCPEKVVFTGAAGIRRKPPLSSRVRSRIFKIKRFFVKPFPKLVEKMRMKYGSEDYRNASPIMRQCLVKIVNEDLTDRLKQIKQDTLLIWGENDDSTPLCDGQTMEKLIENAGLAVIKGAGHYAFLEQTGLFLKILDAYLK